MALKVGGRAIDVRVSVMPASHGERVVMRLLDKQGVRLELPSLGMAPAHQQALLRLIRQPHGIILVTGPTGSGKSTTLYTLLSQINDEQRNIMTIEDPVEYELAGIAQTQVNPKVDMTFARGLRALLRQDPDVVLIGEIRDGETAQIAVQASLTGHLVLSTLHTNTAIGAVTRLRDMGVEPFLLSSSLSGVLAQRLVRRLCPQCREPYALPDAQRRLLGLPPTQAVTCWRPLGARPAAGRDITAESACTNCWCWMNRCAWRSIAVMASWTSRNWPPNAICRCARMGSPRCAPGRPAWRKCCE